MAIKNPISKEARDAQAQCLRSKGYTQEAEWTDQGLVEWDPTALEMLEPNKDG